MVEPSRPDLETALAESIHRARNDLQAIAAMLRLQAVAASDPAISVVLLAAEERVQALANLNARLDRNAKGVQTVIDSQTFLEGLVDDIQAMHLGQRPITLTIQAEPHPIPSDRAKTLGLILNELVVNALKYAFPNGRSGTVTLTSRCLDSECWLMVEDDGVGFDPAIPAKGSGLGRRMVNALVKQIGGSIDIKPRQDGGTRCVVRWSS
ncbi:two-component sensor histidine kinase [Skermanella aerolata]|uniref:sensor histidine kinase n=1 Tax=Skermanella aerolata TaxID=393310 RepID=UPI003D1C417E